MENPATWTEAEYVVQAALQEVNNRPPMMAGLSAERVICDALRAAGLLSGPPYVEDTRPATPEPEPFA